MSGGVPREIRLAARLTHPHVLGVHDSGEADGWLYYVMPDVEGETLRAPAAGRRAPARRGGASPARSRRRVGVCARARRGAPRPEARERATVGRARGDRRFRDRDRCGGGHAAGERRRAPAHGDRRDCLGSAHGRAPVRGAYRDGARCRSSHRGADDDSHPRRAAVREHRRQRGRRLLRRRDDRRTGARARKASRTARHRPHVELPVQGQDGHGTGDRARARRQRARGGYAAASRRSTARHHATRGRRRRQGTLGLRVREPVERRLRGAGSLHARCRGGAGVDTGDSSIRRAAGGCRAGHDRPRSVPAVPQGEVLLACPRRRERHTIDRLLPASDRTGPGVRARTRRTGVGVQHVVRLYPRPGGLVVHARRVQRRACDGARLNARRCADRYRGHAEHATPLLRSGVALSRGRRAGAIESVRTPCVGTLSCHGGSYRRRGPEAIAASRRIVALDSTFLLAYQTLGVAQGVGGQPDSRTAGQRGALARTGQAVGPRPARVVRQADLRLRIRRALGRCGADPHRVAPSGRRSLRRRRRRLCRLRFRRSRGARPLVDDRGRATALAGALPALSSRGNIGSHGDVHSQYALGAHRQAAPTDAMRWNPIS